MKNNKLEEILKRGFDNNYKVSKEVERQSDEIQKELCKLGIQSTASYFIRSSDLNTIIDQNQKINTFQYEFNHQNDIFNKVLYFEDIERHCKIPYITLDGFKWKDIGYSAVLAGGVSSADIFPKRLTAKIEVSNMLLTQNETFKMQFERMLVKALEDKVIESMLSNNDDGAATNEVRPEGLFYGLPVVQVASADDIFNNIKSIDNKNVNAEWVVSGSAKTDLIKLFDDVKTMDGDKFLGSPLNIEPLMMNNYFAYIDLSKVCLANWGYIGITFDNVSRAHMGITTIVVEGYYDFKYLDNNYIKVFCAQEPDSDSDSAPDEEDN